MKPVAALEPSTSAEFTPSPVVLTHRLPANIARDVEEACARVGARATERATSRAPDAVVAHLPRGLRRIPGDALALCRDIGGEVPLLLVCDEPLVRAATTLRFGAVTLVEHGARSRLYSQLRVMLRASRGSSGEGDVREEAGPSWWFASNGRGILRSAEPDGELTFLVPFRPCPDALLADAREILAGRPNDVAARLIESVGDAAGVVHLSRAAHEWVVFWPAGRGSLWLHSAERLPNLAELSRNSDAPRFLRSRTSPGEVVLAAAGSLAPASIEALTDGGPAAFDRLSELDPTAAAVLVEVR